VTGRRRATELPGNFRKPAEPPEETTGGFIIFIPPDEAIEASDRGVAPDNVPRHLIFKEGAGMTIERDCLDYFVSEHGGVSVVDGQGKTHRLKSGDPNLCKLVEHAERVFYSGQWYSEREFETIVQESQEAYWS
jgi:hypothetical protein